MKDQLGRAVRTECLGLLLPPLQALSGSLTPESGHFSVNTGKSWSHKVWQLFCRTTFKKLIFATFFVSTFDLVL